MKPKLVRQPPKPPRPTQRELDQEATIDTFRRILAAIVRKHGVLDVLHVSLKDMQAMKTGNIRVADHVRPGYITIAVKDEGATQPSMKPRLVT